MKEKIGERIRIGDQYYVHPSALAANIKKLRLKDDESFLVCDKKGEMPAYIPGELGFYFEGTRFLNTWEMVLKGEPPLVLFSSLAEDNSEVLIDLTNNTFIDEENRELPANVVFIRKEMVLFRNKLLNLLTFGNHHLEPVQIPIAFNYEADFFDIFEVRGTRRVRRGRALSPQIKDDTIKLRYQGLDDVLRVTEIRFDLAPREITDSTATYYLSIAPKQEITVQISISAVVGKSNASKTVSGIRKATELLRKEIDEWKTETAQVASSNDAFNTIIKQSSDDLRLMLTHTPEGVYPSAGIPWFVAPFGRDGIITALQLLPFNAEVAKGVLKFLAKHQGTKEDHFVDEQPGKILHELRKGEMATLKEIPFIPYYGTVDATPLFLMLAGEYFSWTADFETINAIWPNIEAALRWVDQYGDMDRDGFLEYFRVSPKGLINQGWKDSVDSIMHADGQLAEPPIALIEVQGYAYAGKKQVAKLARILQKDLLAAQLEKEAEELKTKINHEFWSDEKQFFAIALDRHKRKCDVISSNPGHILWCQAADEAKASIVADRLVSEEMFCGWGIRTLSEREVRYNPMSYHNGSVWPFDNAICAAGFKEYGLADHAIRVTTALHEAALYLENARLPELYCGFPRIPLHGPALYPVACTPQAWASGAIFLLIKALTGMKADAINKRIYFNNPVLPPWLEWLEIKNLRLGESRMDVTAYRGQLGAAIELTNKEGDFHMTVDR